MGGEWYRTQQEGDLDAMEEDFYDIDDERIVLKTKDSDEAAYFWTRDAEFDLRALGQSNNGRHCIIWFGFTSTLSKDEVQRLRNDYHNGRARVEPRKYAYRRSEIRNIIHEKFKSLR